MLIQPFVNQVTCGNARTKPDMIVRLACKSHPLSLYGHAFCVDAMFVRYKLTIVPNRNKVSILSSVCRSSGRSIPAEVHAGSAARLTSAVDLARVDARQRVHPGRQRQYAHGRHQPRQRPPHSHGLQTHGVR